MAGLAVAIFLILLYLAFRAAHKRIDTLEINQKKFIERENTMIDLINGLKDISIAQGQYIAVLQSTSRAVVPEAVFTKYNYMDHGDLPELPPAFRICPSCGSAIAATAITCPQCGGKIANG